MTAAARVTRAGALLVAQDRAITSLGVVEIGQVIGWSMGRSSPSASL